MNIFKLMLTWLYFISSYFKAKRWSKKTIRDNSIISEEKRYKWCKKTAKYLLWLYNVKINIVNYNNWLDGSIILCPNHQSNMDGIIMLALNDFSRNAPCAFLAKSELKNNKTSFSFLSLIDTVFVERNNLRQGMQAIRQIKDLIKIPRSGVIFPEGTRNPHNDTLLDFKDGAFKIAQKAYCPIVPVTIHNSYKIYKGKFFSKKRITIIFHKPLLPSKFIHTNISILSNRVKNIVEKGLKDINESKVTGLSMKKIKKKLKQKDDNQSLKNSNLKLLKKTNKK